MSELSPMAQAVLRSAGDSEPGIYATIAATLRAAADQECRASDWKPPLGLQDSDAYELGYASAVEEIKARFHYIAAELDGATTPSRTNISHD